MDTMGLPAFASIHIWLFIYTTMSFDLDVHGQVIPRSSYFRWPHWANMNWLIGQKINMSFIQCCIFKWLFNFVIWPVHPFLSKLYLTTVFTIILVHMATVSLLGWCYISFVIPFFIWGLSNAQCADNQMTYQFQLLSKLYLTVVFTIMLVNMATVSLLGWCYISFVIPFFIQGLSNVHCANYQMTYQCQLICDAFCPQAVLLHNINIAFVCASMLDSLHGCSWTISH